MSLFDQLRRSILGKNEQTTASDTNSNSQAEKAPTQEDRNTERRRRRRVDARKGTRVLIIDDSPTIVTALKKLLTSAKYVTYEAFDAETGLQIAQAEQPELIFLDIVLPGMNGFAALRLMRRDPKTQHIPIIMISGNEQATEQFYANRIGADDFMKKPFSRFEVFARIEGLLDAHHIPRRKGAVEESPPPRAAFPAAQPPTPPTRAAQAARPLPPQTGTGSSAAPSSPSITLTASPQHVSATPIASGTPAVPLATSFAQSVTLQPTIVQPTYSPKVVVKPVVQQTAPTTATTPRTTAAPTARAPTPASASPRMPEQQSATANPQVSGAVPTAPPAPVTVTAATPAASSSPLEARKELTLMGLQYFDQQQFIAAIKRGDKLAFELFVAGGGVDLNAEIDGKTPLQVARENGRTQIFALLRSKLSAMNQ